MCGNSVELCDNFMEMTFVDNLQVNWVWVVQLSTSNK
jgi:hypothetical protein